MRAALDHFASGWYFDGFREHVTVQGTEDIEPPVEETPVEAAGTWLLRTGWKRHGRIYVHERIRAAADAAAT